MKHKQGNIAVFISCDDRRKLDKLVGSIHKATGFRPSLKAIISKAIEVYAIGEPAECPVCNGDRHANRYGRC